MAVVTADSATVAEAFSKALLVDARSAAAAAGEPVITGALLVDGGGVKRIGSVAFAPFNAARPIGASAEPLR
jgi:hypothetical protein